MTILAIPTYFGGQLVQTCIGSILDKVENAKIFVYKNDTGWLKACNYIMETTKDEDIIFVNDDTVILTDIVKAMEEVAAYENVGIVGGLSLAPNAETINNYGISVFKDGNTAHRYYGQPKDRAKKEGQQAVEGSLMLVKRQVIKDIGLFDEDYGQGYRAEVDYCFKARERGWKIMSTPDAQYIHFVSQTMAKLNVANDTHDVFLQKWGRKIKQGKI